MIKEQLHMLSFNELINIAETNEITYSESITRQGLIVLISEEWDDIQEEKSSNNNYPIEIEGAKYNISFVDDNHNSEPYSIPYTCNITRIMFIARDPYWAFAYWDISHSLLMELKEDNQFNNLILRIYDHTSIDSNSKGAHIYFDIPVQLTDRNWYINISQPGTYYSIELLAQYKNSEMNIAKSNIIHIPRVGISENIDENWILPETDKIIEIALDRLYKTPFSWGAIPQRIMSFRNIKYFRSDQIMEE